MRESHRNKANSSSTLTRTWCGFAWRIYCLCKPRIFFASSNSQWQQGAHTLFGSTTKFSPLPGIDLVLFIFLGVVIGTVVRVKVYRKMKNDLLSYICMNFRIYRTENDWQSGVQFFCFFLWFHGWRVYFYLTIELHRSTTNTRDGARTHNF